MRILRRWLITGPNMGRDLGPLSPTVRSYSSKFGKLWRIIFGTCFLIKACNKNLADYG